MITICYLNSGLFSHSVEIKDHEAIPVDAVMSLPPVEEEGAVAYRYVGPDLWEALAEFPEVVLPVVVVSRLMSKSLWLANALYFFEKREFARLEVKAGELTSADFNSTDPGVVATTYWRAFLVDFNGLGELIDLGDQGVIEGVNLFGALCNPPLSAERINEILDWA